NIVRDPTGALTAYYCKFDKEEDDAYIAAALFSPNTVDTPGSQRNGLLTPKWTHTTTLKNAASMSRPCPVFAGLPLQHGKTPSLKRPTGRKKQVIKTATMKRQVLLLFCSDAPSAPPFPLQVMSRFYGTTICVPQAATLKPTKAAAQL